MSSLLEKLAEKSKTASIEKTAEQVFCDAFIDELVKLGYDEEFIKSAGLVSGLKAVGSKLVGAAKGLFRPAASTAKKSLGAQVIKPKAFRPKPLIAKIKALPKSTGEHAMWGRESKLLYKLDRRLAK